MTTDHTNTEPTRTELHDTAPTRAVPGDAAPIRAEPGRRGWPDRVGYLTAAWAAVYTTIALIWTVTGEGFPFGQGDPNAVGLLRRLPVDVGAPLFAAVFATITLLALLMSSGTRPTGGYRRLLLGAGWLIALTLLVVVPEADLLAVVGYAPLLLAGAPFGWPPDVDYGQVFDWTLANYAFVVAGGFLLAATVLAWQRRTHGACARCGRGGRRGGWTRPAAVARWGRWAVAVAMAVPLMYAATRLAWVARIPLGVSGEFIDDLHATDGMPVAAAGLGTFAAVGAVLTLGLVRPWGERFPRWMVGLAGRRVPVTLAVVPATLISVLVTAAGLSLLTAEELYEAMGGGMWSLLPQLLWPVWGAALAAATLAYHLRRRGHCRHCHAGTDPAA